MASDEDVYHAQQDGGPDVCHAQQDGGQDVCHAQHDGGQDVWMGEGGDHGCEKKVREHLVITVNGIDGSAEDWRYAADEFVKEFPDKVIVHCSERNTLKLTHDGVDVMGERLADEVLEAVTRNPGVKKISFIAHSLGGLVARYAIGKLYEPPSTGKTAGENGGKLMDVDLVHYSEEQSRGKIAGLEPVNFITVATPHLGCKGKNQLPMLWGVPLFEKIVCLGAHLAVGRSGRHLFLTDNDEGKLPLLRRMVNDCGDLRFMSALRAFKRRVAYSNVIHDQIVGWRTSSIRRESELPQLQSPLDNKYPHVVNVENENDGIHGPRAATSNQCYSDPEEEEMVTGLTQVPWQRVDVSFANSKYRFVAHSTIQVKYSWMQTEGADVIYHMIDNFHL